MPPIRVFSPQDLEHETLKELELVVERIFSPSVHVKSIGLLEGHLHSIQVLTLSNGSRILLKQPPKPTTPLLRREQVLLETEARALALLEKSAIPHVPSLLLYDRRGSLLGSPLVVRQYTPGETLRDLEAGLSIQNRQDLDRSLGSLASQIGGHVADSFGFLDEVARGLGKKSWREVFVALVENIIRDSEDVFVNIPYTEIRQHVRRLSPALDEVTVPRLVVMDLGRPSQVLLDPETKQFSGIIDFGNTLWGDILMTEIFEGPSSAVLDGFGRQPIKSESERTRQLLYACYRSVCRIITEYYRHRNVTAEIDSRRQLTTILAKLSTIKSP
ncbi:phosphotransferase family protein [Aspergillus candidus]|uniref:Aminoglycoside phosphotransferase domain-containing protein n=1 Tax=Aspergillus candidus TaxID=41067 RepID=A0A2I2F649_ASPCN|nr:hypothetical protein BDW47DRAFT_127465 [Aspergillus candidus]PLB36109.1 hypothetical protein BDW47DRAFT_127465 [Aspergillus candidus]